MRRQVRGTIGHPEKSQYSIILFYSNKLKRLPVREKSDPERLRNGGL